MKYLVFLLSAGALASSPSAAQSGPVPQQSSDQLICKLSGDCGEASEATAEKPGTRGFSIAKPGTAAKKAAPASTVVPRAAAASAARATSPTRAMTKSVVSATQAARFSIVKPGRADLLITFVTGSAVLTEQAKVNAGQFVKALSAPQLASMRFAIEGHTDAVGNRAYNQDLSQRRAQAVVDYLSSNGVSRSRFDVRGYGFDKPLNPRNPKAAANRRVEVVKAN